jgi:hypothetical protein
MASISIYSVAERLPPIDEPLLLWVIGDNGYIQEILDVEAIIAIPEDSEEYSLIPIHIYPEMVWEINGCAQVMFRESKWSFARIERG